MTLLIGCFIDASLFIICAAIMKGDAEDEMATERESRMWINALADESKRGHGKRSRYAVSK